MPRYAAETRVPVERSRAEIEQTLIRYGATEFHSGWKPGAAMIGFSLKALYVRFLLPLPEKTDKRFAFKKDRHDRQVKRTEAQVEEAHKQETRQRWRALLLTIKAKLEAVECGISTIEQEFLAFIVMPNQVTLGEWLIDQALPQIRGGEMPRLALPAPKSVDAEIVE